MLCAKTRQAYQILCDIQIDERSSTLTSAPNELSRRDQEGDENKDKDENENENEDKDKEEKETWKRVYNRTTTELTQMSSSQNNRLEHYEGSRRETSPTAFSEIRSLKFVSKFTRRLASTNHIENINNDQPPEVSIAATVSSISSLREKQEQNLNQVKRTDICCRT